MSDWNDCEIGRNTDKIFFKIPLPLNFCLSIFKVNTLPYPKIQGLSEVLSTIIYLIYILYIMEYYSAVKKNETVPFVVTWINLEMTILSSVQFSHSVVSDSS